MIPQLRPADVLALREAEPGLVILDVREPVELTLASLPGVVHIPMREIPRRLEELDPDARIVVMCHHGVRSQHVAIWLVEQDFSDVSNLRGGIDAWSRELGGVPRY
jgi:rhodanese-related sulfurtransferase